MHAGKAQRGSYRQYDLTALDNAFKAGRWHECPWSSKAYNVPLTTLNIGRFHIDCVTSGAPSLFSQEQESFLVEHIKTMSQLGYGYTRSEVVTLASDYAVDLGLRDDRKDLTMKWFYNFIRRWPEIHIRKPSSLSELRAKSASPECINNYFTELDKILTKYDFKDKPHLIYNVDEKGINTGVTKPPNFVTSKEKVAQVVTSERSQTITVLGCGNAAGANIPPFLVFPGKRMLPELLTGASPGCDVYDHALCPENIRSTLRKSGIYPFSADVADSSCTMPSLVYKGQVEIEHDNQENNDNSKEKSEQKVTDGASKETGQLLDKTTEFFNKRGGEVLKSFAVAKKARRSISSIIGGNRIHFRK
ncbi:LOW QUALITY PROTEIN: hypothetical protein KUTeg_019796 [Tegillarca granosa]|uniref:HTH CENPB-type domain-containing protein n=1 Tax=Tegillarca granosa TaxID=220873 RepID=A0ABQ9EIQ5_TEGGR|nr:LOW QUALITY PROTEIN: hypothetical protein KUTeg_019796 [Tegillarca granosa]